MIMRRSGLERTLGSTDFPMRRIFACDIYFHTPRDSTTTRTQRVTGSGRSGRALRHGSIRFEPEELIGFVQDRKPLFPVGEGFRYTDAGYLVLGRLIEAASGQSYYPLLLERIVESNGLDDVVLQDKSILRGITPGYTVGARNLRKDGSMKFDPSSEWTGGGLPMNPTILVRFLRALADGQIVGEESLSQMLNSGWRDSATPDEYYGFGLFVYDQGASFGHGGLWPGYRTHVVHYVSSK